MIRPVQHGPARRELINLYWYIGSEIVRRQEAPDHRPGPGAPRIVDRLAADLRTAFPSMRGFSSVNLRRMRQFALAWPDSELCSTVLSRISLSSNLVLINKLKDQNLPIEPASSNRL